MDIRIEKVERKALGDVVYQVWFGPYYQQLSASELEQLKNAILTCNAEKK